MSQAALEIARIVVVLALLCVAGALATPRGRLPLALRGVLKVLHRDGSVPNAPCSAGGDRVPVWKKSVAFLLVLGAIALTCL